MFNWIQKSQSNKLSSIVQHTEGLAFASILQQQSSKPRLTECIFQPQLSDSKTTLNQLLQNSLDKKSPLTTLLDSNHFTLLLMERPGVSDDELPDAIRWQIKEQLKYPAEEAIIQILDIPGQQQRGRLPMVYVIAAHQDAVKSSIELLEETKFDLRFIDIPELAQRNISALLQENNHGVALLSLHAEHSLLTITHKGELYLSRTIDVGYEQLDEPEKVEQSEGELSLEQDHPEMQSNVAKIVLEIQRSLDYYESHYGKAAIGNLVIAPLETEIPSFLSQLKEDLGLAVRSLDLNEIIQTDINLEAELQAKCFSAIGAALRQAADSQANSNID